LGCVPFQPVVHEQISAPSFLLRAPDDLAESITGARILFLNLRIRLELLHGLLVGPPESQQTVPFCDHWDYHEKRPSPRAPYLVQALKHPSALGIQGMRRRLRMLSAKAGAVKADGTPLRLHPHDCRRVFGSEHLNNNTPMHVIQALLGHATINTVLVYAKLYPQTMVEEYRKAVRGLYIAFHGGRKPAQSNPRGMGRLLSQL